MRGFVAEYGCLRKIRGYCLAYIDGQEMQFIVEMHDVFSKWLENARINNDNVYAIVIKRLRQIECGNFGDCKTVGGGVSELRLRFGPGYRLYYTICDRRVVFMLCAGSKSEQAGDIKKAQKLAKEIRNG
jgi:putative addiction module killer protein